MRKFPEDLHQELSRQIQTRGVEFFQPTLCKALLKDLFPKEEAAVHLLVCALEVGAVAALRTSAMGVAQNSLIGSQTKRLEEARWVQADAARWAIECWAQALGIHLDNPMGHHIFLADGPAEEQSLKIPSITAVNSPLACILPKDASPTPWGQDQVIAHLGMHLKWIPAGAFDMGSHHGDGDEKPVHQVSLTQAFWLGKTQVTQAQWKAVMGSNPSHFIGDDRPVENVSWDDCKKFCRKLTKRNSALLPNGYQVALPTEAQWEYACRAGTVGDYAGELDRMGWYDSNSWRQTQIVAKKQPNAWGLHDMHGNVFEWCADWFGAYPARAVSNPTGPKSGSDRVMRGGGWFNNARSCRSADRSWGRPDFRYDGLGFRLSLRPIKT